MTAARDPDRVDPAILALVSDYFERADRFTRDVFANGCAANPNESAAIQQQYDALRRAGLLTADAIDGPRPDPWTSGARESHLDPDAGPAFDVIGPYQPLKELGRGGQAVVYLAEDVRLNRPVALKVMKSLGPLSETMMRRFRREAEVASRLDHPGICAVYDAGVTDGIPYIAMRFVEGQTLADCIDAGKKRRRSDGSGADGSIALGSSTKGEIQQILKTIERTARALHVAHEAGIIHRDVKPGNIMLTPTGDPVLLDFGLAGDEDGGLMTLTASGELLGTPAYMSPEQLMARRIRLDRRTDVYSLGVTLFECLTLSRPYRATTREAIYEAIQFKDPLDIRRLNPALPEDLRVIVETALEKDRDRRYQTAEDLAEDLRRVREHEPISARRVSAIGRVWRWARRRPVVAALCGVLAVGVPALAAVASYILATRPAVLQAERLAVDATVERLLAVGYDELNHGDKRVALERFDAAAALRPAMPAAIAGRVSALQNLGRHDEALAALESPELDASRDAIWLRSLQASGLHGLGRHDEAKATMAGVDRSDPTAFDLFTQGRAISSRCRSITDPSRFLAAHRLMRRAILVAPRARNLYHFELAHIAFHYADERLARQAVDAIDALFPSSPIGLVAAARCATVFDDERAKELFDRAESLAADDVDALRFLANALGVAYRPRDAVAQWRRVIALDEAREHDYRSVVQCCCDAGDYASAVAASRRWIERLGESEGACIHLAGSLLELERFEEAERAAKRAVALAPDSPDAIATLAHLYFRWDRDEAMRTDAVALSERGLATHPDSSELLRTLGNHLVSHGQPERGVALLERAVRADPRSATTHGDLARALRDRRRFDEAVVHARRVVGLTPGYGDAHDLLGQCLQLAGDYEGAIESLRTAIECEPDVSEYHRHLAWSLLESERSDEALVAVRRAVELDPTNAKAHESLGLILQRGGDKAGAESAVRRSIELDPSATAYQALAEILVAAGRRDEAVAAYRTGLDHEPRGAWGTLHRDLGILQCDRLRDYPNALRNFEKWIEYEPDSGWARACLGHALRGLGRHRDAARAYRESLERRPAHEATLMSLGVVECDRLGEFDRAVRTFRACIDVNPRNEHAHYNLSLALGRAEGLAAAIGALRAALEHCPKSAMVHAQLAKCLRANGQNTEAIEMAARAMALAPEDVSYCLTLGSILLNAAADGSASDRQRFLERAVGVFEGAVAIAPNDAWVHQSLGIALEQTGDGDGALVAYRRTIELDPQRAEAHCSVGRILAARGDSARALAAYRHGHALGAKQPGWRHPSADWVRAQEREVLRVVARLAREGLPNDGDATSPDAIEARGRAAAYFDVLIGGWRAEVAEPGDHARIAAALRRVLADERLLALRDDDVRVPVSEREQWRRRFAIAEEVLRTARK